MKSIFFSLLFALCATLTSQAQDGLHIIVTNNTSSAWTYKLGCSSNGVLVDQSFAPNSTTEFSIASNGYQFPLFWGAMDAGGCYNNGSFSEPSAPTSTTYDCTHAVLEHAFAASSDGVIHLFVTME